MSSDNDFEYLDYADELIKIQHDQNVIEWLTLTLAVLVVCIILAWNRYHLLIDQHLGKILAKYEKDTVLIDSKKKK